jgi:hypothetical protein
MLFYMDLFAAAGLTERFSASVQQPQSNDELDAGRILQRIRARGARNDCGALPACLV